jgi:hypothetical protein
MMEKRYRIIGYGKEVYSNLKDAVKAYKPKMPYNAWGFIRRTNIFVPARRSAELSDPGQSDDEAEGFEEEPAQVEGRSEPQMDQTLTSATLVDESSENQLDGGAGEVAANHSMTGDDDDDQISETENPLQESLDGTEMKTSLNSRALSQDVVDENLDKDMGDDEADKGVVAEQDLEAEDVANEILEAGETSADGFEEDSDGEIIHEIRAERPEGTLEGLKEITIILKF